MNWNTPGSPTQIEDGNKLVTSAKEIAKLMNQFYIDKVKLIRAGMGDTVTNLAQCKSIMQSKRCSLSLQHVTVEKIRKLIASSSKSKDELDNFSVMISAEVIAAPLHHIITLSILLQRFPTKWKNAKVLPLHKKQSTLLRKNYRPVAILSPLSEVLKKLEIYRLENDF